MQKALRIFLFVLIVIGVVLLCTQNFWVPKLVNQILSYEAAHAEKIVPAKKTGETVVPISISTEKIKEENFSGTVAKISGSGVLATYAQVYIQKTVDDFRTQANTDVPDMIKKFGAGSPPASYEIDIDAKHLKNDKTQSIVISVYTFTGGAHGSTYYKVITTSSGGKILSLANIIKQGEQNVFTDLVKKELNSWRPEGSNASPVFPDEVKDLTFDSFSNWSLDDKNLTIYFDQYAIGPSVLGAVAFPMPVETIKNLMQ